MEFVKLSKFVAKEMVKTGANSSESFIENT